MFRSQEFCPGILATVFPIPITASVPTSFTSLFPDSLFLSCSLPLWPVPESHNVKVFGGYPETLPPNKKEATSCLRQEGDPGLWGDLQLAPRISPAGSSHSGYPGLLSYTFFKALFSQTTKCTYPNTWRAPHLCAGLSQVCWCPQENSAVPTSQ